MLSTTILVAAAADPQGRTPSLELLEFIGDWSNDEARHLLDPVPAARKMSQKEPAHVPDKETRRAQKTAAETEKGEAENAH